MTNSEIQTYITAFRLRISSLLDLNTGLTITAFLVRDGLVIKCQLGAGKASHDIITRNTHVTVYEIIDGLKCIADFKVKYPNSKFVEYLSKSKSWPDNYGNILLKDDTILLVKPAKEKYWTAKEAAKNISEICTHIYKQSLKAKKGFFSPESLLQSISKIFCRILRFCKIK